jgi:Tfp pilus assembly major pilin PilA
MYNKKLLFGFTLIQLISAIVIVAILATTTILLYQNHMRKAYFTEIVQAATPYKMAVAECAHDLGTATGCSAGNNSIPATFVANSAISSITIINGVITVTPKTAHGITENDTYILTPVINAGIISWSISGGAVTAGYTK